MSTADSVLPRIDLHVHTNASDGTRSPAQVVREAVQANIRVLAITDHDTTDGLAEASIAASRYPELHLINGVELSATTTRGGDLHLLGYFIDPSSDELQHTLQRFRDDRVRRVRSMVARLQEVDIPITVEQVDRKAEGGAVSRAHVARVLIDLGMVESIDEAFARLLGRGRPGFVPRVPLSCEDAIRAVRRAGGVSVLAHPLTMGNVFEQLPELVEAGLAGLEVHYGPYSEEQRALLARIALEHGLIATGGSDYHGPDHREGRELGAAAVPESAVLDLQRAAV